MAGQDPEKAEQISSMTVEMFHLYKEYLWSQNKSPARGDANQLNQEQENG